MTTSYSVRSLRRIKVIYDYIAQDNPAAAERTVDRIREATRRLETLPYSEPPRPARDAHSLGAELALCRHTPRSRRYD